MALSDLDKIRLKKFIEELKQYRAAHTEFVTVYIPPDYNLNKIIDHLYQEYHTATNIKSSSTRKNVLAALEKMIQHLKLFKQVPKNGLAVFSGNILSKEGKIDVRVWSIEPPQPLNFRIYRCDKEFLTEPLEELLEEKGKVGLLLIDRREATFGFLIGKRIEVVERLKSAVPGKTRAGGQCLKKDTRVLLPSGRETKITNLQQEDELQALDLETNEIVTTEVLDYWQVQKDKVFEIVTEHSSLECSSDHVLFVYENDSLVEKTAEEVEVSDYLAYFDGEKIVKSKVVKKVEKEGVVDLIDISTHHQNFFANGLLVHNSAQRFERVREGLAKDFFKEVGEAAKKHFFGDEDLVGILVGGPGPTKYEFLDGDYMITELKNKVLAVKDTSYTDEFGLKELVERSQDVLENLEYMEHKKYFDLFLKMLGTNRNKVSYNKDEILEKLKIGGVDVLLVHETYPSEELEELIKIAENFGTKVFIIPDKSEEGDQLKSLGGIGAIFRF